ncbi:glycosyltransferase family 2 protein [Convivina intestini]|uniref:Glycosyltransferase involved in cell wall biosynthesis n=1 Tax=Convivina intestini TaxID=1505726 RepID=A0A2U1DFR0_9LACO|nr:glycosyltransferase family 2 protein [Convivina intestini]PVY86409.1 glycosyltransferase involved in cell wall biosynthesis [Convivina intestini]CAH1850433.1 putative glycosyltransferase YkoT [Convivina intestini]SDB83409.1 Glycosyltransferase involved in cell wall bisynthesis [Leuconostocaceae bacterium R-53105]
MIIRQKVPRLGLILPAYNEQEVLKITLTKLRIIRSELVKSGAITADSFIMIVDDGSKDRTWALVNEYEATNSDIIGVKLSRNFGHQPALLAGMSEASKLADIVITLDADLQDNPEIIGQMVAKYHEGYEIVYAVRSSRQTDTWFKRNTALAFYKVAAWLGVDLIPNHADFRLMSKTSVAALMKLPERNLFLRAMVPLLGYPSTEVTYERGKRQAGQSKYPLKKMLTFAIDGITSFSVKPIRFLFDLGVLVVGVAGIEIIYTIFEKLFGNPQSGWSSLMISIWLLGGINLIAIGVVGIYIGKIFTEVKQRPRFQIENVTGLKDPQNQADISIYKSVSAN